jgi:hypothetical protein
VIKKRKILFLDGNCQGRALVDNCDGQLVEERVYCLSSLSDDWAVARIDDNETARKEFYEYFN